MMTSVYRAGLISSLILVGLGCSVAAAQDIALAERTPRFWYATSSASVPHTVEPDQMPILRQKISLRLRNAGLPAALAEISRQTGLRFVYTNDIARGISRLNLRAEEITVAAALAGILWNEHVDVLFSSARQAALVARLRVIPHPVEDSVEVKGRVLAKGGGPLVGASVVLQLSDKVLRAATGDSGRFVFLNVPEGEYTTTARYIGYRPITKKIRVDSAVVRVDFVLEPVATKLDELVTTATGQQRRRDVGNAITTIQADSVMQHAVIRNLTDLLTNRVPGLTAQHTTGAPGDPAKLRLRGLGSALRSNDPVVVVDGVRIYAVQSEARSGNLANLVASAAAPHPPAPSPLDQIDPNTIEKVEVLKGPSAATLYGADAANGVIVITTKRGKPGPTRWYASLTYGRTDTPGRYPTGYYRWGHDRFESSVARFCTLLDLRCAADSLVQFQALNVPSLTVLGQGRRAAFSLTASGGSQALTYSVTGSYGDETGLLRLPDFEVDRFREQHQREAPDWMRNPHKLTNWSVTSNVNARLSPVADVTLSAGLVRTEQQRTSLENQLGSLQGTYIDTVNQVYYTPNVNPSSTNSNSGYVLNPTADIVRDYYYRITASTLTFTTALNANWQPRSWFTANGQAGLNVVPRDDQSLLEGGLVSPTDSGTLARGTGRSIVSTFIVRGLLTRPLGHGFVFRTSVGADLTSTTTSDLASAANRLAPGTSGFLGAAGFTATGDRVSTSVFGWYVEPTLTGDRFSLSTGLRLDGGSAYGTQISGLGGGGLLHGLLALPKLNGSWVISEERWFPFKALFSSLRLRGAYGQAQVQPGATDRLRLYDQSVQLTALGNTELRPERSTEIEGGFEADVLDSRFSLEMTGYHKLRVDALMSMQLPNSVNGGGSVLKNIGNIRNRGFDIVMGFTALRSQALTWRADLIYNRNINTLLKLGRGVDPNPDAGLVAGYPVSSRWAYPIVGFADANADGVIQPSEVRLGDSLAYMGQSIPTNMLALNTQVVLFGGAVGITAGASYNAGMTQINGFANTNWVLNRALVDPSVLLSQQAAVVAAEVPSGNGSPTLYGLMQAVSTWRFHTFSVSYQAPARVARLLRAQTFSVALQGANLGLHTSYRGKDPDVNAWSPGESVIDGGQLPQPRTWQLAISLGY